MWQKIKCLIKYRRCLWYRYLSNDQRLFKRKGKGMIRKLLCWLGWHEYRTIKDVREFYDKCCPSYEFYRGDYACYLCYKNFGKDKKICKHCGKVKIWK